MKGLSKTELYIMKCIWSADKPLTATQIQEKIAERYGVNVDRRSVGTLMHRLGQKGYVAVDLSTRLNMYTAKVGEREVMRKKSREILKLWYDGEMELLVSDLYSSADDEDEAAREGEKSSADEASYLDEE